MGIADKEETVRVFDEICSRVPANRISRESRTMLLLALFWTIPVPEEKMRPAIEDLTSTLREAFETGHAHLSKANAYRTYLSQLAATIGLLQIEEGRAQLMAPILLKSLSAFPSHAAAALIRTVLGAIERPATLKTFEMLFNTIADTASEGPEAKFGQAFTRMFVAIANWKATNDEKQLLALSKEERSLVMDLPPFEARITHRNENSS
jgi:hypothetical protein